MRKKIHLYNNIDILNITQLSIKKNDKIINIPIIYIENRSNLIYNIKWQNIVPNDKINKSNHFYLDSFDVYNNKDQLKIELSRLFINRDKYKSIHFHLDNNGGGDIVPAHLILRCLLGDKKEKWMKNIVKILINKDFFEWNCWKEENIDSPNYDVVKYLDLDLHLLSNYKTKYNAKIYFASFKPGHPFSI